MHSRLIPDELLTATAPQLSILASSTDLLSKAHVTAAAMLADALSAIDGENWLSKIGDTHMFLQRQVQVTQGWHLSLMHNTFFFLVVNASCFTP